MRKIMKNKWTKTDIDQLKTLLKQGLYYGDIGKALGRTKSAVAGVVMRLGISPNRTVQLPNVVKMAIVPKVLTKNEVCNTSYRQGGAVPMIALDKGMCKWPMFDRDGYCGARCTGVYCDEHMKVSRGIK
jgi:hypothetical protein